MKKKMLLGLGAIVIFSTFAAVAAGRVIELTTVEGQKVRVYDSEIRAACQNVGTVTTTVKGEMIPNGDGTVTVRNPWTVRGGTNYALSPGSDSLNGICRSMGYAAALPRSGISGWLSDRALRVVLAADGSFWSFETCIRTDESWDYCEYVTQVDCK